MFQKQHLLFSPGAIPFSPESPVQFLYSPLALSETGSDRDEQAKRGRPPANAIQTLISQGSVADSSIRCRFCSRVFPREKSLQAHMRTHTGSYIICRLQRILPPKMPFSDRHKVQILSKICHRSRILPFFRHLS